MSETAYEVEQALPVSLEAERSLLGSILLDASVLKRRETEMLSPDNFSPDSHRRIYPSDAFLSGKTTFQWKR